MKRKQSDHLVNKKSQTQRIVSFSAASSPEKKKNSKRIESKRKSQFSSKQVANIGYLIEEQETTHRSNENFRTFISPRQKTSTFNILLHKDEENQNGINTIKDDIICVAPQKSSFVKDRLVHTISLVNERLSKLPSLLAQSSLESPITQREIKSLTFAIETFERQSRVPVNTYEINFDENFTEPKENSNFSKLRKLTKKRIESYESLFNHCFKAVDEATDALVKMKTSHPLNKLKQKIKKDQKYLVNININNTHYNGSFFSDSSVNNTCKENIVISLPNSLIDMKSINANSLKVDHSKKSSFFRQQTRSRNLNSLVLS